MKKIILTALIVLIFPYVSHGMSTETWLKKLAWCESGNRPNITILDSNKKYSYGLYQFQKDTFWAFGKAYGIIKYTEYDEIENIIHDVPLQKRIASRMYEDGLASHWQNCAEKIGVL